MKVFIAIALLVSTNALSEQLYYFEYKSGTGRYEFVEPAQGNECSPSKYDSISNAINAISFSMRSCAMNINDFEPKKDKGDGKWTFVSLAFMCSGYQSIIELHKDKAACSKSLKESRDGAARKSRR